MTNNMSDEDVKGEMDAINADIAKSKGLDPETGEPLDTTKEPVTDSRDGEEEIEEPAEVKTKREPRSKEDEPEDKDKDLEDEDEEEEPQKRTDRRIPLSKFQELKRTSREQAEAAQKTIADLTAKLNEFSTKKEIGAEVKAFSEKFDMPEDTVMALLDLSKKLNGSHPLDVDATETLKKSQALIKKEEAKVAFEDEFSSLIEENPEAADVRDQIRKEAYKEGNLDKSLYEIYQRYVKPTVVQKKKTGESSRGAPRTDSKTLDFAKLAENVKNNVPNALAGLSGEDQDKLFEWMGKQGSRYSGARG